MGRLRKTAVSLLIALVVFGLAYAVWPTPWRERTLYKYVGRINRLSGQAQILCGDGWHRLAADPFDDLAKAPAANLCQMTPLASGR
jgi:hypothetical protein